MNNSIVHGNSNIMLKVESKTFDMKINVICEKWLHNILPQETDMFCSANPEQWNPVQIWHIAALWRHLASKILVRIGSWSFVAYFASSLYPESMLAYCRLRPTGTTLIARFMGSTWGLSGADRTQVGPILAPCTLLSGKLLIELQHNGHFIETGVLRPLLHISGQ